MPRKKIALTPALAVRPHSIEARIHVVRGLRVMLDSDLAALYDVETRVLNQAVLRNTGRFPPDFAFQLSLEELESLGTNILDTPICLRRISL